MQGKLNYSTIRTQAVVVDGSESSIVPVKSGVPQGSVLVLQIFFPRSISLLMTFYYTML